MDTRTCPYCHYEMPLYAQRCPHCTSFSEPPEQYKPGPIATIIMLIVLWYFVKILLSFF